MVNRSLLVAGLATVFGLSAPAAATSFSTVTLGQARDGLEMMRELNVITIGNLNSNSHVQGKAFVGGSLYGAASGYATTGATGDSNATFGQGNSNAGATASSRPTLAVAGSTYTSFTLQDGQNGSGASQPKSVVVGKNLNYTNNVNPDNWSVKVGGNLAGFQNVNGGPSITYGGSYGGSNTGNGRVAKDSTIAAGGSADLGASLASQAATMKTDLNSLSTVLASLTSNGTVATNGSNITFDFSKVTSGYGAYTIDASTLFSYNGALDVILGTAGGSTEPVVINVTGSGQYVDSLNMNLADSVASEIIWNFVDATGLTINANFTGSILAPNATIVNSSNITGSVVANVLNQNAEVHLATYSGTDALVPTSTVGAVPEAATWAMMVVGFGLIGRVARSRRATTRIA
ncbi:collagen-binding domain-containing protein [Sphingomonas nostoxanthinifaciens]|uniref:collagen-binding domain-containing protein n=1 Tax=Sphingomonas nostoxanthinifaciens TaxID=2872652 RepID=UPI001CC21AE4|nr:collagen-binding domain-containing protein [Sphingomonas nostoxanthinifaciens]UAK24843.1 choice-of-anchor A family protein [Sphingomonas nostoxanthinifaciens]